jgi:hypothetical protein
MPICPKCGNPRVDRYCAKCGTSVPPDKPAPRSRSGGRGIVVAIFIFGALLMAGLFFVRSTATHPPFAAPEVQSQYESAVSLQYTELRGEADARLHDAQTRLKTLQDRVAALHNQQTDWDHRRAEVENLRQRLGTARVMAEEEGRWPVRAAGRTFDRTQIKDAIDRTEQFLAQTRMLTDTLKSASGDATAVAADAARELDAMSRARDEFTVVNDASRIDPIRTRFDAAAARFDAVVNNQSTVTSIPDLPDFDLDSPRK